jgi:hypothetical protein
LKLDTVNPRRTAVSVFFENGADRLNQSSNVDIAVRSSLRPNEAHLKVLSLLGLENAEGIMVQQDASCDRGTWPSHDVERDTRQVRISRLTGEAFLPQMT